MRCNMVKGQEWQKAVAIGTKKRSEKEKNWGNNLMRGGGGGMCRWSLKITECKVEANGAPPTLHSLIMLQTFPPPTFFFTQATRVVLTLLIWINWLIDGWILQLFLKSVKLWCRICALNWLLYFLHEPAEGVNAHPACYCRVKRFTHLTG